MLKSDRGVEKRHDADGNEATIAGEDSNPSAFGNDIDELVANIELKMHRQNWLQQDGGSESFSEGLDTGAEGHSNEGSFVELNGSMHRRNSNKMECAIPEHAFPGMFKIPAKQGKTQNDKSTLLFLGKDPKDW